MFNVSFLDVLIIIDFLKSLRKSVLMSILGYT